MPTFGTYAIGVGVLQGMPQLRFLGPQHSPYVDLVVVSPAGADEREASGTRHEVRVCGDQARNINASLTSGDRVFFAGRVTRYSVTVDGRACRHERVDADVVGPSLEHATAVVTSSAPAVPHPFSPGARDELRSPLPRSH